MNEEKNTQKSEVAVPWYGYVALIFAIVFFSGVFASSKGALSVLDFGVLAGKFGTLAGMNGKATTFAGQGGAGARDGFLFAFSLFPTVMFAIGVVEIVDHLGGLKAAQKLLTPILQPLLGLPGISGLALVSSLQSTDAGAGMTKALRESGDFTERERLIFSAFQFSGGGTITNYLSSGAAVFPFLTIPILYPLIAIMVFKVFGANLVRIYLKRFTEEELA